VRRWLAWTWLAAACGPSPAPGSSEAEWRLSTASLGAPVASVRVVAARVTASDGLPAPLPAAYPCASEVTSTCLDAGPDGLVALGGLCASDVAPEAPWRFDLELYSQSSCIGAALNGPGGTVRCRAATDLIASASVDGRLEVSLRAGSVVDVPVVCVGNGPTLAFVEVPATGRPGIALAPPVRVRVVDGSGAGLAAPVRTITLEAVPGGAAPAGTLVAQTDGTGTATFPDVRFGVTGVHRLLATTPGLPSALSDGITIKDNDPPLVSILVPPYVRGTAALSATASDPGGSVASLRIERAPGGSQAWSTLCAGSSATIACPWSTGASEDGYHDVRAVAVDAAGNEAVAPARDVLVDNAPPAVSMNNPGGSLSGLVTLAATASDSGSGIASVEYQWLVAGAWQRACLATRSPWRCSFDTTLVPDGRYSMRAVAADLAGNVAASVELPSRSIDNTRPAVALVDPGAQLVARTQLGTVAYARAGVVHVRVKFSPSGKSAWSTICEDGLAPYACEWDVPSVADGPYELRATMLDASGRTTTSAPLTVSVEAGRPRAADVASSNGGTETGRIEAGDTLDLAYSRPMRPASLLAGWDGAARPVRVLVRDGALAGGGPLEDQLELFTDAALSVPVAVGRVVLGGDYVKGGLSGAFDGTMSLSGATLRVVLGSPSSPGAMRRASAPGTLAWTPSASALDTSGAACSTWTANESAGPRLGF
jgi:hypothetical protein